jgi:hypothetical protein
MPLAGFHLIPVPAPATSPSRFVGPTFSSMRIRYINRRKKARAWRAGYLQNEWIYIPNFFRSAGRSCARKMALTTHTIMPFFASAMSAFVA